MRVKVELFAILKEALGDSIVIEVTDATTVAGLLAAFAKEYPQFAALTKSLQVAVDHTYARPEQVLVAGQETAFIPPVSGG